MGKALAFTSQAREDVREAFAWYELQSAGLGDRFLRHVEDCLDRIQHSPEGFAVAFKMYRRAIVRKFPYVIFYRNEVDTITVHAVFHSARDPKKWRRRLS